MKKTNKKGFTLIELLAVIVILGVIMAIAIPAMTKYIDDSKKDSMVSSASQFISAGADLFTSYNALPVPGACTYVSVTDIELEKGGTSPYTNDKFNTASFVKVERDATGKYTYSIYLTDGTNGMVGTEADVNGKTTTKRGLVKLDSAIAAADKTPTFNGSSPVVNCTKLDLTK